MKLQKCKQGHFYDGELYTSCPHCGESGSDENKTVALVSGGGNDNDVTVSVNDLVNTEKHGVNISPIPDDDQKTISIYSNANVETVQKAPIVGWLVCTKGTFYGQDFRLKSGRNFIGRGHDMDVCLDGENSVSRSRHATIIHEPRQNMFLAQPGDSNELFYLNDSVVLSPVALKKNDVLQIGEVSLMLIPCCDDAFNWQDKN